MSTAARIGAPALFIIATYFNTVMYLMFGADANQLSWPLWIALLAAAIGATVASIRWLHCEDDPSMLAFWGLTIKLCLIPFFATSLPLLTFILGNTLTHPERLTWAWGAYLSSLASLYITMVASSLYGIAATRRARARELLTARTVRSHVIAHVLPVADVLSAIKLYRQLRRAEAAQRQADGEAELEPHARLASADEQAPASSQAEHDTRAHDNAPPATDTRRATSLCLAAALPFIMTAYVGSPVVMFGGFEHEILSTTTWLGATGAGSALILLSAVWFHDRMSPVAHSHCCVALKLIFLPLSLLTTWFVILCLQYALAPIEPGSLALLLLFPLIARAYCATLVSSIYGFTAAQRARTLQLISADTAFSYTVMLAIPLVDIVAAVKLNTLLAKADNKAHAATDETGETGEKSAR